MIDTILELYERKNPDFWEQIGYALQAYNDGIITKQEYRNCIDEIESKEARRIENLETGVK